MHGCLGVLRQEEICNPLHFMKGKKNKQTICLSNLKRNQAWITRKKENRGTSVKREKTKRRKYRYFPTLDKTYNSNIPVVSKMCVLAEISTL